MTISATGFMAMLVTMLVISAVPGPSDFAVVARSLSSGFGQAVVMVLGIIAADAIFILLAVFGLTAIAEHAEAVFSVIKIAGGLFVIWMGILVIRSDVSGSGADAGSKGRGRPKAAVCCFQCLLVCW